MSPELMSTATSIIAATPAAAGRIEPMVTIAGLFQQPDVCRFTRTTLISARFGYIRTHTAIRVVAGRATGVASRADGYCFPDPLSWEHNVRVARRHRASDCAE